MPTANVYRAGKTIRSTILSAAQAEQFRMLAQAVHAAGQMVHGEPGQNAYTVLARLDELLDQTRTPADVAKNRWPPGQVIQGEAIACNQPAPVPLAVELRKAFPAGDWRAQAENLGMVPLDGLPFDHCELTDTPPAPVYSGAVVVGHASSAPQIRAYVRFLP